MSHQSHEALQAFLQRHYGPMHFLGAKQPEGPRPPPAEPQVDDAIALVPLIRGAFRKQLSGSALVPLQRPLLGLRLPSTDLKRRAWVNLRVGPAFSAANGHLKVHYYDTLDKPVVDGVADTKPQFAKALERINAIDADLVKSLLKNKDTIIDNAVRIRRGVIARARDVVGSGEAGDEKPKERYNALLEGFKEDWDAGVHAFKHERVNFTAGVDADQWKRLPDFARLVEATKDGAALEATLRQQETHQFNVIVASMQLQIKYYAALVAAMSADGFDSKLVRDAVRKAECMESTDPIGTSTTIEFIKKCERFLKALLQERLELMQTNIYTYFTALLGQNDAATRLSDDLTVSAVFGVFSAFYDKSSITRRTNDQFKDALINNQGAENKILLGLITSFTSRYELPKLSLNGLKDITDASVNSVTFGIPLTFKGSLNAKSEASAELVTHIEQALNSNKLLLNTNPAGKGGKRKSGMNLSMPRADDHFPAFRHAINAEVAKHYGAQGAARNIAFDVASSIVHAVGQSNPIFALSLCAKSTSDPKEHFAAFPAVLHSKAERTPAAADEGAGAANSLLQKAPWVETFLDNKQELRNFTPVADIDRLFVLKTNLHPAHTPQHAGARAEQRKGEKKKKQEPQAGGKKDGKKKPGSEKQHHEAKGGKPNKGGKKRA